MCGLSNGEDRTSILYCARGTVGGSTHRAVHYRALGGEPPFLKVSE